MYITIKAFIYWPYIQPLIILPADYIDCSSPFLYNVCKLLHPWLRHLWRTSLNICSYSLFSFSHFMYSTKISLQRWLKMGIMDRFLLIPFSKGKFSVPTQRNNCTSSFQVFMPVFIFLALWHYLGPSSLNGSVEADIHAFFLFDFS